MSSTKPTLLLIHGCFGGPACYDILAPHLEKAGYPTVRATFPSLNPGDPSKASLKTDVEHLRNEHLLPLIEKEKKDVLLLAWSYAGIIGPAAAVGLSKSDRADQKLQGGVVGVICIAANLAHENTGLIEAAGGVYPPWITKDEPRPGLAIVNALWDTFYHDADPALKPELESTGLPHGYRCLDEKAPAPCWAEKGYAGRLAYVRTTMDRVNPLFAQNMWLEGTGVDWHLVDMETSHSPMISQPEALAEKVVALGKKFESL